MAFIESIENLLLAVDSFDQIFLSPIMLSLIVRKAEGWGGRGERRGWEGCVSATVQLTSRWLWRLWFSGCPAYLLHDVILIEPGSRGSAREAGEAAAPALQPQEALGVRSSPPRWAAQPDALPAAPALLRHCGSSRLEDEASSGWSRLFGPGGCPPFFGWGGRFLPVSLPSCSLQPKYQLN